MRPCGEPHHCRRPDARRGGAGVGPGVWRTHCLRQAVGADDHRQLQRLHHAARGAIEVHPDGRLEALSESCLANHVGINGLVFSNDGFMVFQRRSAKVFTNPNQLCPGFSGAIKLADIKNRRSGIENLAEMDIFREMFEELGIKEKMITQHRFLGLSRELLRGGKPEMFFGVELAMCAADIQKCMSITKEKEGDIFLLETRNDRVYLSEQQSKRLSDRFESLVIKMETDANARASLPLLTNLAFWVNQNQAPKIIMHQNKL